MSNVPPAWQEAEQYLQELLDSPDTPDRSTLHGRQVPSELCERIDAATAEALLVAEQVAKILEDHARLGDEVYDWADDEYAEGAGSEAYEASGLNAHYDVLNWITTRTSKEGISGLSPYEDLEALRAAVSKCSGSRPEQERQRSALYRARYTEQPERAWFAQELQKAGVFAITRQRTLARRITGDTVGGILTHGQTDENLSDLEKFTLEALIDVLDWIATESHRDE
jgi:hypothetical protein